jgi:hypothetical protein
MSRQSSLAWQRLLVVNVLAELAQGLLEPLPDILVHLGKHLCVVEHRTLAIKDFI